MKIIKKILLVIFFLALVFTRFYNLGGTARFTRDESYDIVKLHQYWIEKRITLVGAINVTNEIVYSSLTYYMLMPFAVLGNFEPVSPVYGVAFYGTLTAVIFLLLAKKVNRKLLGWCALLVLVWFPLVQSSRWSWNPHLVSFWVGLGVLTFLQKNNYYKALSGVFFGLAFHNHYLSIVSTSVFIFLFSIEPLLKKNYKDILFPTAGFVLMIVPFAIFDLRHPPGLFFTGYLKSNMVSQGIANELTMFPKTFIKSIYMSLFYMTQKAYLAILLIIGTFILTLFDIKVKSRNIFYLLPVLFQIAAISFLPTFENRYFLLGITFYFLWLIAPRKGRVIVLQKSAIALCIIGGAIALPGALTKPLSQPPPSVVSTITNFIKSEVKKNNLENINIASLASPDPDPLGLIYRDVLLSKEIRLLSAGEYGITDNLFVISTSDEQVVRNDPANVMQGFREGKVAEVYNVSDSQWKVYLFNRY